MSVQILNTAFILLLTGISIAIMVMAAVLREHLFIHT